MNYLFFFYLCLDILTNDFLKQILINIFNYFNDTIGYEIELISHKILNIFELLLNNEKLRNTILEETLIHFAIIFSAEKLFSCLNHLKNLIQITNDQTNQPKYLKLLNVLNQKIDSSKLVDNQNLYKLI